MAASATDNFRKGAVRFTTTLASSIDADDTTISLTSTTGLPTDTGIDIVLATYDDNGAVTAFETVTGVVSGSNLSSCIRGVEGTASSWPGDTEVTYWFTAAQWNDLIDTILNQHTQAGAHKSLTTDTVTTTGNAQVGATLTVDTIAEKTAANGVSIDGLNLKDGKLNTNNSVVTANITDLAVSTAKIAAAAVTAAKLGLTSDVQSQANAGTAGGTMYYLNLGGVKLLWARSTAKASSTSLTQYGFTLPTSFFSNIRYVSVNSSNNSSVAGHLSNVDSVSTSAVTTYLWTTSGTGTAILNLFVIGD